MDTLLLIISILLLLAGIAGSVLPVLPGPPLAFGALILLPARNRPQTHLVVGDAILLD
jgi:hypothetical protein